MRFVNRITCLFFILLVIPLSFAITDSNSSNNHFSTNLDVVETESLSVTFVKVDNEGSWFSNPDPNYIDYENNLEVHSNYLNRIYPLSDNNLNVDLSDEKVDFPLLYQECFVVMNEFANHKAVQGLVNASDNFSRIIGVTPPNFLGSNGRGGGCSNMGLSNLRFFAIVPENFFPSTAHEIAHTYDLCHDWSESAWNDDNNLLELKNASCRNRNNNDTYVPQEGCTGGDKGYCSITLPLAKLLFSEYNSSATTSINLMGSWNTNYAIWVDNATYSVLLDIFQTPVRPIYTTDPLLLIRGSISKITSLANFTRFQYTTEGGILTNTSQFVSGNASLVARDALGVILYNLSFHPIFYYTGANGLEETNESTFMLTIPPENVSVIELYYNGTLQESIIVSLNTPAVTITSPTSGNIFTDPFNITWNAFDADNDTLGFAVLLSNDNGSSWATLAMDMNETYLEMDNADYTYGTLYKVKVIVTDGINSNSSESNGTFTIIPPPSVSVESISELYSLDSLEVFEGVVLNDGGQTLPELAWMFGTGLQNVSAEENVSLGLNERLFVIFEHNYSSGGNMNVSLFAYDNNQSVNDTYSTMILVGDLRIGSSQELWSNSTLRHFETVISNDGVSTLSGISWNVSTGDLNVSGTEDIDLGSEEGVFLIFEHEYADSGDYLVELAASDGFSTVGDAISVEIPDISVEEFQLLSQLDEAAIFEIKLKNDLNDPMNASWVLDTGDEVVQSNSDTLLGVGERVFVLVEHEYGSFW
jgi:hypothetical protein